MEFRNIPFDSSTLEKLLLRNNNNNTVNVYNALQNEDMSEVVMVLLKQLRPKDLMTTDYKFAKSDLKSKESRELGNIFFKRRSYNEAFENYNKAILQAPYKSEAMIFAYSNRSALLLTLGAYSAAIKDIDICVALHPPADLLARLKIRRRKCQSEIEEPKILDVMVTSLIGGDFFNFNVKRHPEIPCASTSIEIVQDECPRIVAAKDIQVGTVVAIEQPFISHLSEKEEIFRSCYYCHSKSLNLIPCDDCTKAMFCDDVCKEKCLTEYHRYECEVISALNILCHNLPTRLAIKAAFKLKSIFGSWKDLIEASNNIGTERMKKSSVNEIYDVNNKYSILNFNGENKIFIEGAKFNYSYTVAMVICILRHGTFFPQDRIMREKAERAFANLAMNLYIFFPTTNLIDSSWQDLESKEMKFHVEFSACWFSFISKLKHKCEANLRTIGLKNKAALIAVRPIKKGEDLTISYVGHWINQVLRKSTKRARSHHLFLIGQITCNCWICEGELRLNWLPKGQLSAAQKKAYNKWMSTKEGCDVEPGFAQTIFKETCTALTALTDMRFTEEHVELLFKFIDSVRIFQSICTKSMFLVK